MRNDDPLERAHRNAQQLIGLFGVVIVLGVVFSVVTGDLRYMLAGALLGVLGSGLVFWAFWSGMQK